MPRDRSVNQQALLFGDARFAIRRDDVLGTPVLRCNVSIVLASGDVVHSDLDVPATLTAPQLLGLRRALHALYGAALLAAGFTADDTPPP